MKNIKHITQVKEIWSDCKVDIIPKGSIIEVSNISDLDFKIRMYENEELELFLGNEKIARTAYKQKLFDSPEMRVPYLANFVRNWDFYDDWESMVRYELRFAYITVKPDPDYRLGNDVYVQINGFKYIVRISDYSPRCLRFSGRRESKECDSSTLKRTFFEMHDVEMRSLSEHAEQLIKQASEYNRLKETELCIKTQ